MKKLNIKRVLLLPPEIVGEIMKSDRFVSPFSGIKTEWENTPGYFGIFRGEFGDYIIIESIEGLRR